MFLVISMTVPAAISKLLCLNKDQINQPLNSLFTSSNCWNLWKNFANDTTIRITDIRICFSDGYFKQGTEGTGCNNINATFLSSKIDDLLNYVKFEFREVSSFSCISKKDGKVSGKNTVTF